MKTWLEKNYEYLNVRAIERKIGCPRGTIYRWAKDKKEIPEKWKEVLHEFIANQFIALDFGKMTVYGTVDSTAKKNIETGVGFNIIKVNNENTTVTREDAPDRLGYGLDPLRNAFAQSVEKAFEMDKSGYIIGVDPSSPDNDKSTDSKIDLLKDEKHKRKLGVKKIRELKVPVEMKKEINDKLQKVIEKKSDTQLKNVDLKVDEVKEKKEITIDWTEDRRMPELFTKIEGESGRIKFYDGTYEVFERFGPNNKYFYTDNIELARKIIKMSRPLKIIF